MVVDVWEVVVCSDGLWGAETEVVGGGYCMLRLIEACDMCAWDDVCGLSSTALHPHHELLSSLAPSSSPWTDKSPTQQTQAQQPPQSPSSSQHTPKPPHPSSSALHVVQASYLSVFRYHPETLTRYTSPPGLHNSYYPSQPNAAPHESDLDPDSLFYSYQDDLVPGGG